MRQKNSAQKWSNNQSDVPYVPYWKQVMKTCSNECEKDGGLKKYIEDG